MTDRQVTNYCPSCKELADRNDELLEVLESTSTCLDDFACSVSDDISGIAHSYLVDLINKIDTAIAKAKGENHV